MRVLVVTVVHTPLDARIHHRQVRAMREADLEVTQVAPWSGYAIDEDDVVAGVVPVDVPRAVGRRRLGAIRSARDVIAELGPRHDLVLLHDPELVLAVIGMQKRLPPVVLDVHEDLAASLGDRRWLPRPARPVLAWLARRVERWAESNLASLLLAEASYDGRFRGTHPLVPNFPWSSGEPVSEQVDDRAVYVGRLSKGRGAEDLVALAEALAQQDGQEAARLELIGAADPEVRPLLRDAHQRGILDWVGFLPNDRAMRRVRGALVGLAPLHDLPNYQGSMPTKVIEYLSHGVPAIVTPLPEAVRLVEESRGGVVVPFGGVGEMLATIRRLQQDPSLRASLGAAGRAYVSPERTWDTVAPEFVAHLRRVAGQSAG